MCVRWEELGFFRWKETGISDEQRDGGGCAAGAATGRRGRAACMLPALSYVCARRIVTYDSAARCVTRT